MASKTPEGIFLRWFELGGYHACIFIFHQPPPPQLSLSRGAGSCCLFRIGLGHLTSLGLDIEELREP